jgi:hypothetical protein
MNVSDQRCIVAVALAALLLVACDVDVKGKGENKDVDVRTPFGDISVKTGGDGPDTGLPVYPGARPLRDDDDDPEHADVKVKTSFVGVTVAAAKYESDAAPQAIIDFYKEKMTQYGAVVECKGDVEFEGEPKQPVCKESSSDETELVTGTEENHRLVSVKARGSGAEFAVVAIQIDKRS